MANINILNPYVYIPSFLKIRTKSGELQKFKPNKPQITLLNAVEKLKREEKPVRIIILKARQMGFSTMTEAICYHHISTNKYRNGLIIAHEDSASQNIYNMFKTYYENTPEEITPMRKRMNAQELLFENPSLDDVEKRKNPGLQSSIKVASARNVNTGRSQTLHFLHCSEVAFWNDAKTLVTGLFQTVPNLPNTTIILESTANGVGGFFYETWKAAESGENDFIPLFFPWFDEPTYSMPFNSVEELDVFIKSLDKEEKWLIETHNVNYEQLKWRRWCIQNNCTGDIEKFHQEYPSYPDEAFIASGRPKFNVDSLKDYLRNVQKPIKKCFLNKTLNGDIEIDENNNGYVEIWKMPEENKFYSLGADVAEGLSKGDYSVGYILDENLDVCAKWRGHIEPDLFGKELVKLGLMYNEAYMGIEVNNHGLATIKAIQAEDYTNIYYSKLHDKATDVVTQKIGWTTTSKTKPLMIDKLAEYIRERYIGVKDKDFISEALTYVIEDNGSTNAQEGCHDDCVMAMAIALQVFLEGKFDSFKPFVPKEETKRKRQIFDGIKVDEDIEEDNFFDEYGQEVSL